MFLGGFAGEGGEGAGENEGEAGKGSAGAVNFLMSEDEAGGAEAFDDGPIAFFGEPAEDALGDLGADLFGLHELRFVGLMDGIEGAEVFSKELGGAFADEGDAEAVDDAGEGERFGAGDAGEDAFGGFGSHAFEAGELFEGEVVEVGDGVDKVGLDELFDKDVAEAGDVEEGAGGEVGDGFFEAGGAA